jgi:hypothetical protein
MPADEGVVGAVAVIESSTEAGKPRRLARRWSIGVVLFDDRLSINGKTFMLDTGVSAIADSAGAIAVSRRHTLTRFALIGPFSLFTPKKTTHDNRELYLLAEGPDWAEVVKCKPDSGPAVRQLAAKITTAAKNVDAILEARRQAVDAATAKLDAIKSDTAEIEARRRALDEAEADRAELDARIAAVEDKLPAMPDQETRAVRKARKLVAEVRGAASSRI